MSHYAIKIYGKAIATPRRRRSLRRTGSETRASKGLDTFIR